MKPKVLKKQLALNKKTIADLSVTQMDKVPGGVKTPTSCLETTDVCLSVCFCVVPTYKYTYCMHVC
jgi:hypothetical protein